VLPATGGKSRINNFMSVKVIIDGIDYEANDGELLIDLCKRNGIKIPHFCYHAGLGPDGNCRMCQVEFVSDRGSRLGISCNAVVTGGMEVLTQSENVKKARASVMEMLLVNHPLDCPICDKAGDCKLQDYYMDHDLQAGRMDFERYRKGKAMVIGPTLVLDQQRCVLCDRCVRFLRDIAGDEELVIAGRGHSAYISTFPGKEVTSPYSLNTVDVCPVGALTSRDFRFSSPPWFLKKTPSVCTTCSRGCSITVDTKDGEIHRMRPRLNKNVNGYWMCDEGRLNYKFVNKDRIHRPSAKRDGESFEMSHEEAIAVMRTTLGFAPAGIVEGTAANRAVVLVSASSTLEEMFQAKRLAKTFLDAPVFVVRHVPDGVEDRLLRRADKHANTHGAQLLNLNVLDLTGDGNETAVKIVDDSLGGGGVLFCIGFNYEISPALDNLVSRAAKVISLSACETTLSGKADLVIPGLTFAEKYGLIVNFEGYIQRLQVALDFEPDFAPTAQKDRNTPNPVTDWKVLEDLMTSLCGESAMKCIVTLRKEMAGAEAGLSGLDLSEIDDLGLATGGQKVG
jgi:NADH-quinone oxidoreductase subunit G